MKVNIDEAIFGSNHNKGSINGDEEDDSAVSPLKSAFNISTDNKHKFSNESNSFLTEKRSSS